MFICHQMSIKNRNGVTMINFPRRASKRKKNITSVLITSYAVIMGISLLIGILIYSMLSKKEEENKNYRNDMHILNSFTYYIISQLKDRENLASNIIISNEIQTALTQGSLGKTRMISEFLNDKIAERDDVQSLHIIDQDDNVISEYKYPVNRKNNQLFINQFDLSIFDNMDTYIYWGIGTNVLAEQEMNTFYVIRRIKSKENYKNLGYLVIYLEPERLQDSIFEYLEQADFEVVIKKDKGNFISFPRTNKIETASKQLSIPASQYGKVKIEDKIYDYVSSSLDGFDMQLFGISKADKTNYNIILALIFGIVVNISFICIASLVMGRKVIAPLEYIAANVRRFSEDGDYTIVFETQNSYTEVEEIANALNNMVLQIEILLKDIAKKEKLQKSLELSVMNHQVKPHFLYNTLNTVSILIAVEQKATANELIKTLAKYYRACLSKGNDAITISEELDIVKEYIKIALIRNPDIVQVKYEIDPSILGEKIPKMTIQAIVENSIKYGVKKIGDPVEIQVDIKDLGSIMMIQVKDNGCGMSADLIHKILKCEPLETQSGFGLKAVVTRIALFFEMKEITDIISIDSREGEYTIISLHMPKDNYKLVS